MTECKSNLWSYLCYHEAASGTSKLLHTPYFAMASRKKVLLKVIILGDSGVGKTSLMNQYVCLQQ